MEILFEMIRVGNIVKVTAIDPVTGTEAVIQAPAGLDQKTLQRQAAAKLEYVMKKQREAK